MQITIELEVPENMDKIDIVNWISSHMDNIPYEEISYLKIIHEDELDDLNIISVY